MLILLKHEWFKFSRRKVFWLSFLTIPALIYLSYLYLSKNNQLVFRLSPDDPSFASQISFPYLVLQEQLMLVFNGLAIFYTSLFITEERRSGIYKQIIMRGYPLWRIALAKFMLLSGIFLVLFFLCFILSWLAGQLWMPKVSYAYTFFSHLPIQGWSAWAYTFGYYALAYLSMLGMLAFMAWVSVIARNKVMTAGIGIGFVLLNMMYTQIITVLYQLEILKVDALLYASIVQVQFTGIASILGGLKGMGADIMVVILLYLVVFISLTLWHERKVDYTD